jgi:hypothetical protein
MNPVLLNRISRHCLGHDVRTCRGRIGVCALGSGWGLRAVYLAHVPPAAAMTFLQEHIHLRGSLHHRLCPSAALQGPQGHA